MDRTFSFTGHDYYDTDDSNLLNIFENKLSFTHEGELKVSGSGCGCCGIQLAASEGGSSGLVEFFLGPQLKTTANSFNEGSVTGDVLQSLVGGSAWDNSEAITYHLEFSDFDGNGTNDWDEDGAGDAMRLAFSLWDEVADITLTEVESAADANLVESVTDADGALGFHFFPNVNSTTTTSGDITLDPFTSPGQYNHDGRGFNAAGLVQGGYGFVTIIHEIGHGLGLEHPHDGDLIPGVSFESDFGTGDLNQGVYTTMSYNDGWELTGGSPDDGYGWQATPMALDIAAIQAIYGADMTTRTGDDTYTLSDSTGVGTFYSSIWDAGGTDEISYTGDRNAYVFLSEATIDATATGGGLISFVQGVVGGMTIAQNAVIENGTTGFGDDLLDGNDTDNVLNAGGGNDAVVGRLGNDTLNGGDGNDLLIGDFDGLTELQQNVPGIGGGISLGSGVVTAEQSTSNDTLAEAIDISSAFTEGANANVGDESTPHVTINGTGNGEIDIFSFTLNNPFARITIDIDNTSGNFDALLFLVDAQGNTVAFNDDSNPAIGGAGSEQDLQNGLSTDSYLEFVPGAAGTYYITLDSFSRNGVDAGATYEMNVSIENELGGASPYSFFFDYFDFSATGAGNDTLNGGAGDDRLFGGDGDDLLEGGAGNDYLHGGFLRDTLRGGDGDDFLFGSAGFDFLEGDAGNDELRGGEQADNLFGGAGDDILLGEGGFDRAFGGAGNDVMRGGDGNFRDVFFGDTGNDIGYGGDGNDFLVGGAGFDTLYGEDGDDRLEGRFNIDILYAGDGNDRLFGGAGSDEHYGGAGNDLFYGGDGDDLIMGEEGDDTIFGNAGFDRINAGSGNDSISGNFNADTFIFTDGFGEDVINDFDALNDAEKIDLSGVTNITDFNDLTTNHLDTSTGDVRIIDGADIITLAGVDVNDLDANDFIF